MIQRSGPLFAYLVLRKTLLVILQAERPMKSTLRKHLGMLIGAVMLTLTSLASSAEPLRIGYSD